MIPHSLLNALLLAYGALVSLYLFSVQKLFNRLQQQEPEVFEQLGRPHLLWNNTPSSTNKFLRFLFSNQALQLRDRQVMRSVKVIKSMFLIAVIALVVLFALTFFQHV